MGKILTPILMGNPLLLKKSEHVSNIASPETQDDISSILLTAKSLGDRVGLAAPQVGILKRIIVYRVPSRSVNPRYKNIYNSEEQDIPWSVLINPIIEEAKEDQVGGWEACVSVPGLMGYVERIAEITYSGLNENGELVRRNASGFHARLIQHEIDHLDGILFPMKVKDITQFGFEEEVLKHNR